MQQNVAVYLIKKALNISKKRTVYSGALICFCSCVAIYRQLHLFKCCFLKKCSRSSSACTGYIVLTVELNEYIRFFS